VKLNNTGIFVYLLIRKLRDVTDGTSKMALVGEIRDGHTRASENQWTIGLRHLDSLRTMDSLLNTPPGANIQPFIMDGNDRVNGAFGSEHPGGANFVFGDGRVDFIVDAINYAAYQAMATMDKGDDVVAQ
jgi:prepilin-type processing-associated H-X9-DG protein